MVGGGDLHRRVWGEVQITGDYEISEESNGGGGLLHC
jgi:hypothetical protein